MPASVRGGRYKGEFAGVLHDCRSFGRTCWLWERRWRRGQTDQVGGDEEGIVHDGVPKESVAQVCPAEPVAGGTPKSPGVAVNCIVGQPESAQMCGTQPHAGNAAKVLAGPRWAFWGGAFEAFLFKIQFGAKVADEGLIGLIGLIDLGRGGVSISSHEGDTVTL